MLSIHKIAPRKHYKDFFSKTKQAQNALKKHTAKKAVFFAVLRASIENNVLDFSDDKTRDVTKHIYVREQ